MDSAASHGLLALHYPPRSAQAGALLPIMIPVVAYEWPVEKTLQCERRVGNEGGCSKSSIPVTDGARCAFKGCTDETPCGGSDDLACSARRRHAPGVRGKHCTLLARSTC